MHNPLAKAMRYLRREYPVLTLFTALGFGCGVAVATLASVATGTLFLMIPLSGTAMAGGMLLFTLPMGGETDRPHGNTVTLNDVRLVGKERDLASISMTQRLVSDYTKELQHMPDLPQRTMDKITAHISDMRDSLSRIRAYTAEGVPAAAFSFTRKVIDGSGKTVTQAIATLDVPMTAAYLAKATSVFSFPQKTPNVSAGFSVHAQRVDRPEQLSTGSHVQSQVAAPDATRKPPPPRHAACDEHP